MDFEEIEPVTPCAMPWAALPPFPGTKDATPLATLLNAFLAPLVLPVLIV